MKTMYSRSGGFSRMFLVTVLVFCSVSGLFAASAAAQKKFDDDLFSVSFPSEMMGWACGRWGLILHTSDSGKTWTRQESGIDYTLSSIFFVDSKRGWTVGDEGTILHTADGGKTWKKQSSPVPFSLMNVFFISSTTGWIVTEQTHILHTSDGGKTWAIQFKDKDFILKAISFSDPMNGWAVGEYGFIYHTQNGGATWRKEAGKFKLSEDTGDVEGEAILFGLMVIDSRTAWAVGIDSTVLRTTDGGKNWRKVETGFSKIPFFGITSDNQKTIVTGGQGMGLLSTDGGKRWKPLSFEPSIRYSWIYGLGRRGTSGFVAVGEEGAIYLGTSTGVWRKVE